ncbi:MAG TPA: hypothetical protein PKV73_08150 [Agriterribacter sp.]|nr:hypothetical protein [Chitinophagaceae bacterium]HRP31847.1 hypothetical protein [Agriterribacter sp.]
MLLLNWAVIFVPAVNASQTDNIHFQHNRELLHQYPASNDADPTPTEVKAGVDLRIAEYKKGQELRYITKRRQYLDFTTLLKKCGNELTHTSSSFEITPAYYTFLYLLYLF